MPTETNFVPENIDCKQWDQIKPLVDALLNRDIDSADALETWMLERSDLEAYVYEVGSRLHVDMTCHTDNEDMQAAYRDFHQNIMPPVQKATFALDQKYYDCPFRKDLSSDRYHVYDRGVSTDIEIFRDENVAIDAELSALRQEHSKITGAQSVEFQGETKTLPAMTKYQENPDRSIREAAWRTVTERVHQDVDAMRSIFDSMLEKRHQVALNAGFDNYRSYIFKSKHRFDYDVKACEDFQDAVAEYVVPLYRKLGQDRASEMGLDTYRAWDASVDVKGRGALDPFDGNVDRMVDGAAKIFTSMDSELGKLFDSLCDGSSLDLETRTGKAPGGYQTTFSVVRKPFIFMNSSGLGKDLRVLLHEAGHAFHTLLGGNDPLMAYRHAPMEFCEVASMSMELTAQPWLDSIYDTKEDAQRAWRVQLEGIIRLLPWIAQIDAFQHWMYTNPTHTHDQRADKWLELDARFGAGFDVTGVEKYRSESWQRQLHLFCYPFYYIEYGIAQLGALQIWLRHKKDRPSAIAGYKNALGLGGSKPLPELFEAAETKFDFGAETISTLVDAIQTELSTLPL